MTHAPHPNGYLVVQQRAGRYRGPDRNPWDIVDEAYWAGRLPLGLRTHYERMKAERGLWWPTTCSLNIATQLAEYSARITGESWEIVGVCSPYLASLGRTACVDAGAFSRFGLDVVSVGEWSLLRALIEAAQVGADIDGFLNEFGLLSESSSVSAIVRSYSSAVQAGQVEEIGLHTAERGIEVVQVFLRGENTQPCYFH